jgi:death-on-curing protein
MIFLDFEQVILINKIVVENWGGLCGIRDKNLTESAINNPQNLFFYQNADHYTIASSYAISIIKNHGFLDGNKRTGFACMNAFLELNDIILNFLEDESVEMMVKVATSNIGIEVLSNWLKNLSHVES